MKFKTFKSFVGKFPAWVEMFIVSKGGIFGLHKPEKQEDLQTFVNLKVLSLKRKPWKTLDKGDTPQGKTVSKQENTVFVNYSYAVFWRAGGSKIYMVGSGSESPVSVDKLIEGIPSKNAAFKVEAVIKTISTLTLGGSAYKSFMFEVYLCPKKRKRRRRQKTPRAL